MTAREALREALVRAMDEGRSQAVGRDAGGTWLILPEGCPEPAGFDRLTVVRAIVRMSEHTARQEAIR
jgi:hypothetical protein